MKVLFITCTYLGDIVLTTGVLASLVDKYPAARFTIACGPGGADLFRSLPCVDCVIILKKKTWHRHWFALWWECITTKWDLVVDFRNSIARILYAKKRIIKLKTGNDPKVIENAAVLGLKIALNPKIWLTPESFANAERILPQNKPLLAVVPASNYPLKDWPIDCYSAMVKQLIEPGGLMEDAVVLVIALEKQRAQVLPLLQSILKSQCIALIGYDLQTVAACISKAHLYVGNDSGMMHVSAALGTPTLGLFKPRLVSIFAPWGEHCAYVCCSPEEVSVVPSKPYNWMETLTLDEVLKAVKTLLEKTSPIKRGKKIPSDWALNISSEVIDVQ